MTTARKGAAVRERTRATFATALVCATLSGILSACGGSGQDSSPAEDAAVPAPHGPPPDASEVPVPNLDDMEPRVQFIMRDAHRRVLADLGNAEEWGRYGMILDAHEVHDAAIAAYVVAGRLASQEFKWRYLLARLLQLQEFDAIDIDAVETALRGALELDATYAPAWSRLGSVLSPQGRHEEASDAFRRALNLDETSLEARAGLARAQMSLGETDSALVTVEPWMEEDPDNWEVQLLLARLYAVAGQRDRARAAATRARELPQKGEYPDPVVSQMMAYAVSATACFKRARSLSAIGEFQQAATNLKVVVEVRPDYAPAHERLGWCRFQLERYPGAQRAFTRAIELAPNMVEAHVGLARTLEALGQTAEARESLARADSIRQAGGARERTDDFVPAGAAAR